MCVIDLDILGVAFTIFNVRGFFIWGDIFAVAVSVEFDCFDVFGITLVDGNEFFICGDIFAVSVEFDGFDVFGITLVDGNKFLICGETLAVAVSELDCAEARALFVTNVNVKREIDKIRNSRMYFIKSHNPCFSTNYLYLRLIN